MLPLIAIGAVFGAVTSIVKGVAWVREQFASSSTDSATDTNSANPTADTRSSSFAQTLAAQAAGQLVPGGNSPMQVPPTDTVQPASSLASLFQLAHGGTDYDSLSRMQAGIAAYGSVGQRADHAAKPTQASNDASQSDVSGYMNVGSLAAVHQGAAAAGL